LFEDTQFGGVAVEDNTKMYFDEFTCLIKETSGRFVNSLMASRVK
jgi:hypothetical protein